MATSITLKGDKELNKKLSRLSSNIKNLKKPLEQSGKYVVKQAVKNFETEGVTMGKRWASLQPSTLIAKARMGYAGKGILQRTGSLMRSIKIIQLSKFLVKISSKNPYYKYHQSTAPRHKLPRRKMLDITNSMSKEIITILRKYLFKNL